MVRNARVPLAGVRVPPGSLTEQAFTAEGMPSVSPARFWQQNLLQKYFVLVTVKHVCSNFAGQNSFPILKERLSFQVGGFLLGSFTERAFTTEGFAFRVAN